MNELTNMLKGMRDQFMIKLTHMLRKLANMLRKIQEKCDQSEEEGQRGAHQAEELEAIHQIT